MSARCQRRESPCWSQNNSLTMFAGESACRCIFREVFFVTMSSLSQSITSVASRNDLLKQNNSAVDWNTNEIRSPNNFVGRIHKLTCSLRLLMSSMLVGRVRFHVSHENWALVLWDSQQQNSTYWFVSRVSLYRRFAINIWRKAKSILKTRIKLSNPFPFSKQTNNRREETCNVCIWTRTQRKTQRVARKMFYDAKQICRSADWVSLSSSPEGNDQQVMNERGERSLTRVESIQINISHSTIICNFTLRLPFSTTKQILKAWDMRKFNFADPVQ